MVIGGFCFLISPRMFSKGINKVGDAQNSLTDQSKPYHVLERPHIVDIQALLGAFLSVCASLVTLANTRVVGFSVKY